MTFAMPPAVLDRVRQIEGQLATMEQVEIHTEHILHAGLYTRTITIPKGVMLTGAQIKIPTLLILSGHAMAFTGDGWCELEGFHRIPASAGRKQIFVALADTHLSMSFPTAATTVEQAEREFTDEAEILMSRNGCASTVIITGE